MVLGPLALLGYGATVAAWVAELPHFGVIWIIGASFLFILQSFVLYWVGDAARYLSSSPQNIALRQRIRREGLRLLRQLHRSREEYDRIVIVGHSLGSVIGYDLITRLWLDYGCDFKAHASDILRQLEAGCHPQPVIGATLLKAGAALSPDPAAETLSSYRVAQLEGWKEQGRYGHQWRISDFVTVGSPLAHAMLLLASSSEDFEDRKAQRELPKCPPVLDDGKYGYVADPPMVLPDGKKRYSPHVLHHAAPFAVTRWSNLYFPAYGGLFGDFIGGSLREVLGLGIHDIPVRSGSWRRLTPLSHVDYWDATRSTGGALSKAGPCDALEALKDAIGLERLGEYKIDRTGPESVRDSAPKEEVTAL